MTTHRNTADYFAGIPQYANPDVTEMARKMRNKAVLIDLQAAQIDRLRAAIREALTPSAYGPIHTAQGREAAMRRILEAALNDEGTN